MIVCVCHRVSDRDIARAVQDGCASFDELQFDLGVATSFGKCHGCAREVFHQHAAQTARTAQTVQTAQTATQAAAVACGALPTHRRVIAIVAQQHAGAMASSGA